MEGKRKLSSTSDGEGLGQQEEDVPRKKSRNYLDSHKSIEKKRRDRINNSLATIKELVPDCKQYGTKKLDKAEILEMCIEYLRRVQSHFAQHGNDGLATSPRDFATEVSTWILQQKQQHNELDSFVQALLLFLSTYGSVVAQRQQQLYAPPSQVHQTDLLSPVTANLSGMAIMSTSVEPPHCAASFPPPYQPSVRALDTHHQAPQVHRPPTSSAQRFATEDPQMQDLWRTQAMMQHIQQQGFHMQTATDHDPPPLVQPPEGLTVHQDVAKATTQPLHHLLMQQPGSHQGGNYPQMIVLQQQQGSTRPLHHPATTTSEEANQQIQQFLDTYTKGGPQVGVQSQAPRPGSNDVQMMNAQDIVHHQIQQQIRMANPQQQSPMSQQPVPSLSKHEPPQSTQAKTPLPGTETLVMGMASAGAASAAASTSLTEELLDSGTSVPAQPETTNVSDIVESENWGATQVAIETTVDSSWKMEVSESGAQADESLEKEESEEEEAPGKEKEENEEQSASTLLLLANSDREKKGEGEGANKVESTEGDKTSSPAAAAVVTDENDPDSEQ